MRQHSIAILSFAQMLISNAKKLVNYQKAKKSATSRTFLACAKELAHRKISRRRSHKSAHLSKQSS